MEDTILEISIDRTFFGQFLLESLYLIVLKTHVHVYRAFEVKISSREEGEIVA